MRPKARAYPHRGPRPRADQQAGYISATSDACAELTCDQQPVHTFGSQAEVTATCDSVGSSPGSRKVSRRRTSTRTRANVRAPRVHVEPPAKALALTSDL